MGQRQRRTQDWVHFPHEADVGIIGYGTGRARAFESAAKAITALIAPLELIEPHEKVSVTCSAPDDDILLVDWLNAVIFEMSVRRMLFSDFRVNISDGELTGEMWGEAVDKARHEPSAELKGATMTELSVRNGTDGLWTARCVIDV